MLTAEERAVRDEFGAWAMVHHPNSVIREAAQRGYDVRAQVAQWVIAKSILACEPLSATTPEIYFEGDADFQGLRYAKRENPRKEAMDLREAVACALAKLERPLSLAMQILPVQRVTFWAGTDRQFHRTAVVVRFVACGLGERLLIISAE